MTNIDPLMNSIILLHPTCFFFNHVQPTRIRNNSKILIENIYSSLVTPNNISGNLTATISDNLPEFLITPDKNFSATSTKLNIFEKESSLPVFRLGKFK